MLYRGKAPDTEMEKIRHFSASQRFLFQAVSLIPDLGYYVAGGLIGGAGEVQPLL